MTLPYANPRSEAEVRRLMAEDIRRHGDFVLSSVRGDMGEEINGLCRLAVWLKAPKAVRLARIERREIARVICDRRKQTPVGTTSQLVDIVDAAIPKKLRQGDGSHPARRTFQALRIAVNDELDPLEPALRALVGLLKPGGRLCVITFHSLEDRIVKNTFRSLTDPCTCPKSFPVCVCGKKPVVKPITRKPITASPEELAQNPRSRSASLRIVEKL